MDQKSSRRRPLGGLGATARPGAGYLEGDDSGDGLRIGAIAGVVMLVPLVFVAFAVIAFLTGVGLDCPRFAFCLVTLFALFLCAPYPVGPRAVGGYLCVYIGAEL